jgi:hypothetical protein
MDSIANTPNDANFLDHQPHKVGEWTIAELRQQSGIWDGDTQLTNLEAIRLIEEGMGAQNVHTSQNGHTSPEGNRHNSQLTRANPSRSAAAHGEYIVSVLSLRPPTDQQ